MSFSHLPRNFDLNAAPPQTLEEWREHLLNGVLRGILVFWVVGMAVGLVTIFQIGRQTNHMLTSWLVVGFYLLVAAAMLAVTFWPRLGYSVRVTAFLLLIYLFGLADFAFRGYSGDGRVFLLAFAILTAIFFNFKRSLLALLVGVGTLAVMAFLQLNGYLSFLLLTDMNNGVRLVDWVNSSAIFLAISVTLVFSVSYLISSLDSSVAESRRERDFVSTVLDTSGALVMVCDPDGRIERFNRASVAVSGYAAAEMVGQSVADRLLTPEGAAQLEPILAQLRQDLQPVHYRGNWLTRTGQRRLIDWTSAVLLAEDGRVQHIVSTGIDITQQELTAAERSLLLAAEHEQRLLAETLAEATLSLTSQTQPEELLDQILRQVQRIVPFKAAHIMLLNDDILQIARWQGYDQLGGEALVTNLEQSLAAMPLEREVVDSRQTAVIPDTYQDPRWIVYTETAWVRSHLVVPILQQDNVLGLLRLDGDEPGEFDDQDAQRLQHLAATIAIALHNSRLLQETKQIAQRVQHILNTVQDGILLLDAHLRVELANPAAQNYLTVLVHSPSGQPIKSLGGRPIYDLLQSPPADALWHDVFVPQFARTFEVRAQPMQTQSGGWVLVLRDTTEARKQQQYLQAQERLVMIGQLAAGIAHDFNNIMTVILLYTQMLLKTPELPVYLTGRLETVFQQSKLAASLISQILDFSRQSDVQRRPLSLLPFLKEFFHLLRRMLPEMIELHLEYEEGEYVISADLTRLQQAVMNLVVNARDAMPDGGNLRLELTRLVVEVDGGTRPLPDMPPGEWICLQVSDTGEGIPPEIRQRIFEPLFTTKARSKGTGLGLSQVYNIIKHHQGYIDVDSTPGEGTTFYLYFPAQTRSAPFMAESSPVAAQRGEGQVILVVEDEQITREAICTTLESFNYRTYAAANGEEAVRLFQAFIDDIALVLSDMVMPDISGATLYSRLQAMRPEIKMIILTGYPFGEEDRAALRHGIVGWIQKPFEVEQIVTALQTALAADRPSKSR